MFKKISLVLVVLLPVVTFAQQGGDLGGTNRILGGAKDIVTDILIPLAFTLALLFFFYGVAKYIWQEGSGKEDGKQIMIWGVVALFVMSSIWGLVSFLRGELGIGGEASVPIPSIGGNHDDLI